MSSGRDELVAAAKGRKHIAVEVSGNRQLTDSTFEIRFERPKGFDFIAGQKISVIHEDLYRDYSLISSRRDSELAICIRRIPEGAISPVLADAAIGDLFHITPAFGYFLYHPSERPAVFVATGTGIAPFVAFANDGVKKYRLLHGVRTAEELYYRNILTSTAKTYVPCLSGNDPRQSSEPAVFHGRVTDFLEHRLPRKAYDFYLCGRGGMLRDATRIIDQKFEGSRIFSELFF